MAVSGAKANFEFGTTWGPADCIQSMNIGDTINDVVYSCNGYDKHGVGTRNITAAVSMALPSANSATVLSYIYPGAESTAAVFRPQGHSSGSRTFLKYTATRTQCNSANVSGSVNGIVMADFQFALDDVTIAAATT